MGNFSKTNYPFNTQIHISYTRHHFCMHLSCYVCYLQVFGGHSSPVDEFQNR